MWVDVSEETWVCESCGSVVENGEVQGDKSEYPEDFIDELPEYVCADCADELGLDDDPADLECDECGDEIVPGENWDGSTFGGRILCEDCQP